MDSPTVLRRRLGSELRRLRERTGLQAKAAADTLRFSATKISRIESGQTTLKESDVRALLELYGVTDEAELRQFISLTRRSTQRGWWHDYGDALPDWFQTYVGMESDASRVRAYEIELIPGLFQTADYARAIFRTSPSEQSQDEIERRVKLRIQRQEIFQRPDPPAVWAILNEAVLRRPVGGPDVMNGQILHLIDLAEKYDVKIQVLPLDIGTHASMSCAFHILSFADVPGEVVYVEALTSSLYLERESDIAHHELAFTRLSESAMRPQESLSWMQELAAERHGRDN
ncbi:helix-turn-helix domain-containing protein [Kitasatospora purpeofusca]|uniref:helix-turn-helix domain-containing protein n=1 Tax=Kitasatospora purpeofusca TaxID=67352 RepID=UPI00225BAC38|nr:helix-turn-helix transcriptional regulator [Kitasatospora purpeofusca]MCX4752144.1 helix-turn-helix domain-containing protein [Kitasatospora purpeofusca]WSR31740.1 helix-turn-helix domain-containing protein [Kitasatospora purpeofusca]WSR39764.1 helix-turn-helix domain-containing protein [Kitasatospora purpeofusca]